MKYHERDGVNLRDTGISILKLSTSRTTSFFSLNVLSPMSHHAGRPQIKFIAKTNRNKPVPGKANNQGEKNIYSRPSFSIRPQLGVGA